jgi:MOSC domain-containing protein YiiM
MRGTIRALFVKPEKGKASIPLTAVHADDGGLNGDHHKGSSRKRQILLMSGSVMDQLALVPGTIHENVVVDGIDVMTLQEGQQLQLGGARVSVTMPCEPCIQMERVRKGLQDALEKRRGMFVRVITPGLVKVSDTVELL